MTYLPPTGPPAQNGVIGSSDLLIGTISINTSTGALTFTPASTTSNAWVKGVSGILMGVGYSAGAKTLTPSAITSGSYAVVGVEIDPFGNITLNTGTSTVTQLNTGSLIASNSPATTSGKMRIADLALWNNSGTYNFSDHTTTATRGTNWIDRRPWARGAYYASQITGGNYTTTSGSTVVISTATLQFRIECSGAPLEILLRGLVTNSGAGEIVSNGVNRDGSGVNGTTVIGETVITTGGASQDFGFTYVDTPSAGSHLYTFTWAAGAGGTATLLAVANDPLLVSFQETLQTNSNNGIV